MLGGDDLRLICRSTSNDVGPLPEDEKDAGKRLLETSRLRPAKGRNGGVHSHGCLLYRPFWVSRHSPLLTK